MLKRTSVKVGDIFQILTSEGVCYGQVIHTHPKYKFIVAIFREFFTKHPDKFEDVVSCSPQLITPFLIQHAIKQGLFSLIDNVKVADTHKKFPIFRDTNNLRKDGKTLWWFWDGKREWKVDSELSKEEEKYPSCRLPSAPQLLKWIETNYRVEKDYI